MRWAGHVALMGEERKMYRVDDSLFYTVVS
jgi:hypothetical protein